MLNTLKNPFLIESVYQTLWYHTLHIVEEPLGICVTILPINDERLVALASLLTQLLRTGMHSYPEATVLHVMSCPRIL